MYLETTHGVLTAAMEGFFCSEGAGCVTSAPITITGFSRKMRDLWGKKQKEMDESTQGCNGGHTL